jgi:hypothetical protein
MRSLNRSSYTVSLTIALFALCLSGCIGQRPIPISAQSGDLIYLNLGGIKRNTVNGYSAPLSEMVVSITDSSNNTYPVLKKSSFKVFPDYTSKYSKVALDKNSAFSGGDIVPFDGGLWIIVQLSDGTNALPLAAGDATITVSSSNLKNTGNSTIEGDYDSIPIEILPGITDPNSDAINNFLTTNSYYQSAQHKKILPSDVALLDGAYGLQIQLLCNNVQDNFTPMIVPLSHDPNLQIIQNFKNGVLSAAILNPKGFYKLNGPGWSPGSSQPEDLFIAVIQPGNTALSDAGCGSLDASQSFYINGSGNKVLNVTPILD